MRAVFKNRKITGVYEALVKVIDILFSPRCPDPVRGHELEFRSFEWFWHIAYCRRKPSIGKVDQPYGGSGAPPPFFGSRGLMNLYQSSGGRGFVDGFETGTPTRLRTAMDRSVTRIPLDSVLLPLHTLCWPPVSCAARKRLRLVTRMGIQELLRFLKKRVRCLTVAVRLKDRPYFTLVAVSFMTWVSTPSASMADMVVTALSGETF